MIIDNKHNTKLYYFTTYHNSEHPLVNESDKNRYNMNE